jgi:hypothetical protein
MRDLKDLLEHFRNDEPLTWEDVNDGEIMHSNLLSLVQQQDWGKIAEIVKGDPDFIRIVLHMAFMEGKGVGMEQLRERRANHVNQPGSQRSQAPQA